MSVNEELLRREVEWVEAEDAKWQSDEPSAWYQGEYVVTFRELSDESDIYEDHCGTAYCVAGHIGMQFDERFRNNSSAEIKSESDPLFQYLDSWALDEFNEDGSTELHVSEFARRKLGLGPQQAQSLFGPYNTAERIRELAEEFAGKEL